MAVAQDRDGFLWVGTQGGLARYDGYHFRSFVVHAGDRTALPDGYIRTLLADPAGGVWIGSSSSGLVRFDDVSETFASWRPDPRGVSGPRSASIDAIVRDAAGTLWIGGDAGLDRYDRRAKTFAPVAIVGRGPQPIVWSLTFDRSGALWAGTQSGLFYRPAHATVFRAYTLPLANAAKPIVYSLFEDREGRMWAGSVGDVFMLDAARHTATRFHARPADPRTLASGQQWAITEMQPGIIWAGADSALTIINATTHTMRRVSSDAKNPGGLDGGRVLGFLHDRSGMVWLANHVGGLLLYNPATTGLFELSASRADIGFGDEGVPAVLSVPGDTLWAGGFAGHLAEFNARTLTSRTLVLPNHAAIQTLVRGHDGTMWIGTTNGICLIAPGAAGPACPAQPSLLAAPSIYTLLEDRGRLFAGGSTGLLVYDIASHRIVPFPAHGPPLHLRNNQVRVLYVDRRHRLWIGTENGLSRVDAAGKVTNFDYVPNKRHWMGPGGMATLSEDRRGRMWAGANGGPLDVIDETRGAPDIRQIDVADGLPHENVDGLAEDPSGRMWASTDKGIAEIDPVTLHARALGLADGVPEGAFWAGAVSQTQRGTILFGGLEGIALVARDAASPWTYDPPLVASALEAGRQYVSAAGINRHTATVELPADRRDIDVEFASLDYSLPQALRYAYKLDGYDRDWIETDSRHRVATYTHLSPGNYTLEIRGTNRLGVWSRSELRIPIRALPAWYETWWFRTFVAALAVLLAYGAYLLRTSALRRRQQELEAIVDDRTRELSEANAKLQDLSLSDPLTGLRNRRFLAEHLISDILLTLRRYDDWRADPSADPPADADVIFFIIDLDHFKLVNDRFGHNAGDFVLLQMRERLETVFRDSDFIIRWGGDEFLAVARGTRRAEARAIAERIRDAVGSRDFAVGGNQTFRASASIGFAAFPFVTSAPDGVSWMQVVRLADHALYLAKEAGRNTWFGVTSTPATDPAELVNRLERPTTELVRAAQLEITTQDVTAPNR